MRNSIKSFPTKSLLTIASQSNDVALISLIKEIIESRYVEEDLPLLLLTSKIIKSRDLEREILAKVIIERTYLKDEMYLKKGMDMSIDNIDMEVLWASSKSSKIKYVREKCETKLWQTIDKIEVDANLEKDKMLKLGGIEND